MEEKHLLVQQNLKHSDKWLQRSWETCESCDPKLLTGSVQYTVCVLRVCVTAHKSNLISYAIFKTDGQFVDNLGDLFRQSSRYPANPHGLL